MTVFHQWAAMSTITAEHILPGKPSNNAFVESFIGKLRDECLNEHWFMNLAHAQQKSRHGEKPIIQSDHTAP